MEHFWNPRVADMTREHKPDMIIFVHKTVNILGDSRRTSAINESRRIILYYYIL